MTADMLWTLLGPLVAAAIVYPAAYLHGRHGWRARYKISVRPGPNRRLPLRLTVLPGGRGDVA